MPEGSPCSHWAGLGCGEPTSSIGSQGGEGRSTVSRPPNPRGLRYSPSDPMWASGQGTSSPTRSTAMDVSATRQVQAALLCHPKCFPCEVRLCRPERGLQSSREFPQLRSPTSNVLPQLCNHLKVGKSLQCVSPKGKTGTCF